MWYRTSRFWHSWAEFVGRPIHLISFFSLEMMFIAMSTFSASYTRRRMFFWSYTCYKKNNKKLRVFYMLLLSKDWMVNKCFSKMYPTRKIVCSCSTYWVIRRHVVVCRAELCHQFICHLIVRGYSFLLHFFTDFHGEMPQALPILVPLFTTFSTVRINHTLNGAWWYGDMIEKDIALLIDMVWRLFSSLRTYPDDQGEASDGWLWVRNWELGVCGLFTKMVFDTVGLCGVPITCKEHSSHKKGN